MAKSSHHLASDAATMSIKFNVNGYPYEVQAADYAPDITLNAFLRQHLHLTATKYMCLEGGCGSCVCVIRRRQPATSEVQSRAANSCLTLLNTCNDVDIITDEGLGNQLSGYHPIQKRLAQLNGTQCGYCSPGFVMNMYGLLEQHRGQVSMAQVEDAFGGNICRCTGYRPILDAMKSFALDSDIQVPSECVDIEDSFELLCPRTGQSCQGSCTRPARRQDSSAHWYWPKTLQELFAALSQVASGEPFFLVAGNTAHGVYRRPRDIRHYIDVHAVPELKQHSLEADHLLLGGNLTLTDAMEQFLVAAKRPGFEYCAQLWQHFNLIANVPVRNNGTLAGNISIKKQHPEFPSDVFITFEALDVNVLVYDNPSSQRVMSLLSYLTDATPKLLIGGFILRAYAKEQYLFGSYKILPRAQNVHAYVNAGFLIEWQDLQRHIVRSARICFGNIRPDYVHDRPLEQLLPGRDLYDAATVQQMFEQLRGSLQAEERPPEASPEYREMLACGLLYKFLLGSAPKELVRERYRSGGQLLERALSSGSQTFETIKKNYPVTQPVQKLEGLIQCSGEATYMNDLLTTSNAVHCAFVTAKRVGATIEQIDATAALHYPGVVAFYAANDIPGVNNFVTVTQLTPEAEEIFAAGRVKYYDQPLGVIAALSQDAAVYAASLVEVTYANDQRQLYTSINQVLAAKQQDRIVCLKKESGKPKPAPLAPGDVLGRGILELESQYHFTMEPQTTIVVPMDSVLQVWSSTQWMDGTQGAIAQMLKVNVNKVQLQVRRVGGAYGAKVTRGNLVACAAALVAFKLNKPARFVQTIESMMECNGKRWACRSDYEFRARASGLITMLSNNYYEDAGCSLNENVVDFLTLPALRNVYNLTDANYKTKGSAIRTDAASSTWCRAPGTAEAIAMTETALEHIAFTCQLDPADVRLVNLRPGSKMVQLLPRFLATTEYRQRREQINLFNAQHRWRKRGLGLTLMEFPLNTSVGFTYPTTVAIYHEDGSVVITHGGIEIGQGINTKAAQVAAFVLGVPLERVSVESSNTVSGANSMITANSMSSEMIGLAVRKACDTLNKRLEPVKKRLGAAATWLQILQAAYLQSVILIASDSYKLGDIPNYGIFGLSLCELELDILTGSQLIRRVDILEDAGESISPNIDVGQVEGAFVMGLGYYLTELLLYDRQTGRILTNRTWNYHPPGAKDIPIDFRIELLQKNPNPVGFMRSKATGEPALCLSVGVLFAMQHAIQSARQDAGLPREWVRLGAPTTPETVVLNAGSQVHSFALN
ncbi:xanthine dehydrogenase/oxidase [Drosophila subobscura]|uniref:xanthine dehydrogenase/oxidase n=1 Tax=Drosophila subobscura TaxID=7241 RepID=UPI00155A1CAE|nr:xanthine dehydrogenase/oxidase [Drosophila subobscura]